MVWFNIKNVSLRHDSRRHKLLPKFWGPFKVIELVGRNAVRLDMPSHLSYVHPVVSTSLLKPFRPRPGYEVSPVLVDGDLEFELDSIVDFHLLQSRRRNTAPVVEFWMRWKDFCEDTWHAPCDFEHAQDTLQRFLQQLPKQQRIKVLKAFDAASLARLPYEFRSLIG